MDTCRRQGWGVGTLNRREATAHELASHTCRRQGWGVDILNRRDTTAHGSASHTCRQQRSPVRCRVGCPQIQRQEVSKHLNKSQCVTVGDNQVDSRACQLPPGRCRLQNPEQPTVSTSQMTTCISKSASCRASPTFWRPIL